MTLLRRETLAFAQQKWPGGYFYHNDLCELAQQQAILLRKDKSPVRAIKSDRAKVVMTAGCISKIFDILNYIYNPREIGNFVNQNFLILCSYRTKEVMDRLIFKLNEKEELREALGIAPSEFSRYLTML